MNISPQKKRERIIFVENNDNFNEAIENGENPDCFFGGFSGDLGRCTWEGNRLIAENIANKIFNEQK